MTAVGNLFSKGSIIMEWKRFQENRLTVLMCIRCVEYSVTKTFYSIFKMWFG